MNTFFYVENELVEKKWEMLSRSKKILEHLGLDVNLYISQCSKFMSSNLNCVKKIENPDVLFIFGIAENSRQVKANKKVLLAETEKEIQWGCEISDICEIWTSISTNIKSEKIFNIDIKKIEITDRVLAIAPDTKDRTATFIGVTDTLQQLSNVLRIYENYYCNIRINSKLYIYVPDSMVKKSKDELYKRVMELKSLRSVSICPESELMLDNNICCCIYEKKLSDTDLIFNIYKEGVPIISSQNSKDKSILSTGICTKELRPELVQKLMEILFEYPEIRNKIIWNQFYIYAKKNYNDALSKCILRIQEMVGDKIEIQCEYEEEKKLSIQVQGPFETSYSLAIVNKKLAEAFHRLDDINASIGALEATGSYEPKYKFLKDKEMATYLWKKSKEITDIDVAIRNMYPPAVDCLNASFNFEAFAWEEDRVPHKYIESFNEALDGVGTTSEFVTKALRDSGLTIPVKTIGNGVDLPSYYDLLEPYRFKTKKKVRFVHISSAFPRKGVDILLQAYCEEFTDADDVCLVIKSFPNPHNTVDEQIKELKSKYNSMPEIEYINEDMDERDLYSIYKAADCYVHVARGEGFGLPVAEAMLAKIPVIVSNNTGLADFCNNDTALIVDFVKEKANSHLTENSSWTKPNKNTLRKRMREFYNDPNSQSIKRKVNNAYKLISTYFTWDEVAKRWITFINSVRDSYNCPSVAMVTTWNTKCGIAEFTRYFIDATKAKVNYMIFPNKTNELVRMDEEYVVGRWWDIGQVGDLVKPLQLSGADVIHIQFNFGLLSLQNLVDIITQCKKQKVVVTFHGTNDFGKVLPGNGKEQIIDGLNKAYAMIVHQEQDRKNLLNYGIKEKIIKKIPLGQVAYSALDKEVLKEKLSLQSKHIIGSYGFMFPHKGFEKVIRAVQLLKNRYPDIMYLMVCSLYDSDNSKTYYEECKKTIHSFGLEDNVLIFPDFLEPEESMQLLQACDLLIMPYDDTTESASGAVRFCVAAKRPIITTAQDIFAEYENCTYQIQGNQPDKIAKAIEKMFNEELQKSYVEKISQRAAEMSWSRVGKKYIELYNAETSIKKKM